MVQVSGGGGAEFVKETPVCLSPRLNLPVKPRHLHGLFREIPASSEPPDTSSGFEVHLAWHKRRGWAAVVGGDSCDRVVSLVMVVVSGGMSVLIRNAQALVPVSRSRLRRDAELLLRVLLVTGRSAPPPPPPPPSRLLLSALCVSSPRIRNLNLHYRGEDRATDVLAFPYAQVVAPGVLLEAEDGTGDSLGDVNLGDVYLGVSYIQQSLRAGERFHDALTYVSCSLAGDFITWHVPFTGLHP
ncbi:endoribonuclease YbeY isoform X2 [Lampetra fluviatilis]